MDAENASKELIAARIGRKTVQTMKDALKTNEIMLLEADIRIAEANLVAMGGCISIELAKDKNRLETLLLNVATKDSIEREQRSKAAYDLGLTEDVQKAKDSLQILNNDVVTPESAACRVRAQRLLDQNVTADLRQARSRVEALKKEARSKIPEAEKADRHARDTAAKVRTAELTQSVQRVEALMKQASPQVKSRCMGGRSARKLETEEPHESNNRLVTGARSRVGLASAGPGRAY